MLLQVPDINILLLNFFSYSSGAGSYTSELNIELHLVILSEVVDQIFANLIPY